MLYILWLQVSEGGGGQHVHTAVHTVLQELIQTSLKLQDSQSHGVIVSVSTAGRRRPSWLPCSWSWVRSDY